jgi:aldose 1-epimerase
MIPTGKIEPVAGTPYDFTKPTAIGARIKQIKASPVGYDLNYVLDDGASPRMVAVVSEPKSGRTMTVLASGYPGVQFYTGNFLDGKNVGKGGAVYKQYGAFCLEAQNFPDAANKIGTPGWDKSPIVLKPGETYKKLTIYKFGVDAKK